MTTNEAATLVQSRERLCRRTALTICAIVTAIALTVLVGWTLDIELLKRVVFSTVVMMPWTAIEFLCAVLALAIRTIDSPSAALRRCGRILSGLVLALAVAMLVQRLGRFEWRLNLLLFADELKRYPYRPVGLMAGNTALAFTLLGAALISFDVQLYRRRLASGLALAVIAVAAVALVGYTYGARSLYSFDQYAVMASSTATCCLALGVAVILGRPNSGLAALLIADDAGAVFVRRMLPVALTAPFLLGLAWLGARRSELLGRETAVALVVVSIAAIYTAFLFHSAHSVGTLDRECRDALRNAEAARALAEEANRGKADFLTMMSHELRTPLNAIRGYTQLIELGVRGPVTDQQRVDLARIRRSEEHLLGIIGDILDFASVERGQYRYVIVPVRLSPLLEEATDALSSQAATKGVRFVSKGWHARDQYRGDANGELEVLADAQKLRQALINLLSNSIKFANPDSQVAIDVQSQRDGIHLLISDSGRGIPADRLATIFDPFAQLEPTLTRTTEGVGLGLAISRQLLRGMSSDIHVESTPGVGSCFSVLLPRPSAALSATAAAPISPAMRSAALAR
jgi:signal transduction histidine kinase